MTSDATKLRSHQHDPVRTGHSKRNLGHTRGSLLLSGALALAAISVTGCERAVESQFNSTSQIDELEPAEQTAIRNTLEKWCGEPGRVKLLGADEKAVKHLQLGAEIYHAIASNVTE